MAFTAAHISDLHLPIVGIPRLRSLLNKRALGWLSWSLRRRATHRLEVMEALITDVRSQQPDHIVITGDLTNLGLEEEFRTAVTWLQQLGHPHEVFVVPGNHDAYVPVGQSRSWDYWIQYLESDAAEHLALKLAQKLTNKTGIDFPTVRIRGPVAFIGVWSAQPTGLLHATGTIGPSQLERLEHILSALAGSALCRIVLIHHPPVDDELPPRRRLTDAAAFRAVLTRAGADLILHGHTHKTSLKTIPGPSQPIPVIGVRSASDIGHRPQRLAQYHLYTIEYRENDSNVRRFRIAMTTRSYDATNGAFRHTSEQLL